MTELHDPSRRSRIGLLALLVAIGAALRIVGLDGGLWYDEIVALTRTIRQPLTEILTTFETENDHKLYSVLANVSIWLFGEHAWSLRLPAILFGLASLLMLYRVGLQVTCRREAMLATVIMTVSYHHVWYSQNARGYTVLLFLLLLATSLLLKWMESRRRSTMVAYAVVLALGAYTHVAMVFVGVSHALVCAWELLSTRRTNARPYRWSDLAGLFGGAALLTLLFYSPILLGDGLPIGKNAKARSVATPLWAVLEALRGLKVGFGAVWVVLGGALVAIAGASSYLRQRRTLLLLFVLPPVVTIVTLIVIGRPIRPRMAFMSMGFALLIAVRGAAALGGQVSRLSPNRIGMERARVLAAMLMTLAAVAFSALSLPRLYRAPKQDYLGAVGFVEQNMREGDLVALARVTTATPILHYLGKSSEESWRQIDDLEDLLALRSEGRDVWVIYTFSDYLRADQPELWAMLQDECEQAAEFEGTLGGGWITVRRCPAQTSPDG